MRRPAAAILLALAALAALPAGKPLPPSDDAVRYTSAQPTTQAWRSRAVPVCVARLSANRALTPDDLEAICGCTADTYLAGHGNNPLPGLADDHLPIALENDLLNCTSRTRPDQRVAVRELNAVWPQGRLPAGAVPVAEAPVADVPATDGKPDVAEEATEASASGDDAGGGFWAWLGTLALPAWLTGASILWWIAGGIFLFGLLLLKIRRRDPRNDLVGPPAHLRRGAPPQPPRRPDLPR